MNEALQSALTKLRLSGLAGSLEVRLQEAGGNGLNHAEFLELELQDELAVRAERLIDRRVKAAAFREAKTLEDFDWQFNPSIKRKQIFDLATCRFVREARDVLLLGPPGTGKSHLVQSLGYQVVPAKFRKFFSDRLERQLGPANNCKVFTDDRPKPCNSERIHEA